MFLHSVDFSMSFYHNVVTLPSEWFDLNTLDQGIFFM